MKKKGKKRGGLSNGFLGSAATGRKGMGRRDLGVISSETKLQVGLRRGKWVQR